MTPKPEKGCFTAAAQQHEAARQKGVLSAQQQQYGAPVHWHALLPTFPHLLPGDAECEAQHAPEKVHDVGPLAVNEPAKQRVAVWQQQAAAAVI